MNWPKTALRSLGKRLPATSGTLRLDGIGDRVVIRRDRFGIPHISASGDADAWYGVGFCHGQDRAFQIETRLRVVRGTLAALIGPDGLPMDRLSRRIGFRRYGEAAAGALEPHHRRLLDAYTAGVTAGATAGQPRRPHEFVLLRSHPTPYEPADVLGFLALMSFSLASNWDAELARLQILRADGPEAVSDLDPAYPPAHPASDRPGEPSGGLVDRLAADLASLASSLGLGGGSNNWAIAPARTSTGRPILANDPHLAPVLPPHWYLLHVAAPDWSLAGASFPGTPAVAAAHNGRAAWGVTAGLIDNTDLFLEEVGPDGASVRRGDTFVPCEVRREVIRVRGGDPETIDVLITDRGPIVGPALEGDPGALSMSATWLRPHALSAMFEFPRIASFDDLRAAFAGWNGLSLNVAFADESGSIGWQLIGSVPRRTRGSGMIPLPAWEPGTGWEEEPLPFDDLPHLRDPESGYLATANNLPSATGPDLGSDFLDGYRVARISELLAARDDWDPAAALRMQMDRRSLPWREIRDTVLAAAEGRPGLERARRLLAGWDGDLGAGSPAATLFEVLVAELVQRIVHARAPQSARWALGEGFHPLVPLNMFLVRRMSHLLRLLDEQPDGWFDVGWPALVADSLVAAESLLVGRFGNDPAGWAWGTVRPLTLKHPLGTRPPLDRVFNLGPVPHGGDANTVNPAPVDPADPLGNPDFAIASLRMVVDVGAWERSRFVLPGGQSGNPFSRHYGDMFGLWQKGDAVPIPWTEDEVARATRRPLVLEPAPH
jgi:penicillin amidase